MNIVDVIAKLFSLSAPELLSLLERLKALSPDLAPAIDRWITALGSAASPDNLAEIGAAVLRELASIGQGKLEPKSHPSDAA